MLGNKREKMEALRARIEQIEQRPVLAQGAALLQQRKGQDLLSAPGVLVHEIFADERRNCGAALGFALAQARGLLSAERPAILCMQLMREVQDMGLPYGAGLKAFGVDPANVVLTRTENIVEFLWAVEEAVIADEIFSTLMGEDVEARRGFIQTNAKDVRFLDI